MKTVNGLTHKNIWSQHSLEHHLYFHVRASIRIDFVFFFFGGGFYFWAYDLWGKRSYKIDLNEPVYNSCSSGLL